MLPKNNATTVLDMIITLYGMLKSGVARSTKSVDVYVRGPHEFDCPSPSATLSSSDCSVLGVVVLRSEQMGVRTAGGRSQPRCASGGCSVYRMNALRKEMVTESVLCGGTERTASSMDARRRSSRDGMNDRCLSMSSTKAASVKNPVGVRV